jgi:hypothetical protein
MSSIGKREACLNDARLEGCFMTKVCGQRGLR